MAKDQIKSNAYHRELRNGSAPTFHEWEQRIAYALRNLEDRTLLNRNPLAKLNYIEKLAAEHYGGHLLPRGLALHDVVLTCIKKILAELGNEPRLTRTCKYLQLLVEGLSCKEISRRLGLSREHVSRHYRKKAIELLTEEFLSTAKNGE